MVALGFKRTALIIFHCLSCTPMTFICSCCCRQKMANTIRSVSLGTIGDIERGFAGGISWQRLRGRAAYVASG